MRERPLVPTVEPIARGASASESADSSGALNTLADQPFSKILLWLVAVGLVALALWQASEVIWGYRNRDGAERVRKQVTSGAKAVIYATLGVSAAVVALGSGSSSSQSQQQATSGVLAWPAGQVPRWTLLHRLGGRRTRRRLGTLFRWRGRVRHGEGCWELAVWVEVDGEFVVAPAEVLHER